MKHAFLMLFVSIAFWSCSTNNNGTVTVVPIAPTALIGTVASTTQINLSWTDNATNEDGYKIERKNGTGSFSVIGSTGSNLTTFNDLGLSPNTAYTYRVYAFNGVGNSLQYSNEVTLTTALLPSLTTAPISDTSAVSATCGGNITSDAGSSVTARGICWSTSSGPTTALTTKTIDGTGTGSFTSNITGLSANTTYYVRAYATNANGTNYGNEVSFTTTAADITTGLVGYWPFNGNANDESGNGNNGTVNGAILTSDRFGNAGKAYSFDGVSNVINVATSQSLVIQNTITISAWIKRNNPSNLLPEGIFGPATYLPNTPGYFFRIIDRKVDLGISLPYTEGFSTSTINTNDWYHVVGVYNNNSIKIFISGVLDNETIVGAGRLDNWSSSNFLTIGQDKDYGTPINLHAFDGKLDDIRIYNRALSATEVSYLATH